MTGAMYSAVAGLKTHMSAMNVIGNNIANVNTNAYKASSYTFKESLYTTSRAGSDGTATAGGVNPAQIGYGCSVGSIDMDMASKNYSPTGRELDICIDGDGFLMVGDKGMPRTLEGFTDGESAKSLDLVRLGRLKFDSKGYLTDDQGNVVYGFLSAWPSGTEASAATGSNLITDENTNVLKPNLTEIRLPVIRTDENGSMRVCYPMVDSNGRVQDAWNEEGTGYAQTGENSGDEEGVTYERVLLDSIQISPEGRITGVTKATDEPVVIGQIAIGQVDNPEGLTHVDGRYFRALDGAGKLHITSMGGLITHHIGEETEGGTPAEDEVPCSEIISGGDTKVISGGLESSGTDLATEISNMILMQRGYQANTRIITVTDTMLEELVNMKR